MTSVALGQHGCLDKALTTMIPVDIQTREGKDHEVSTMYKELWAARQN